MNEHNAPVRVEELDWPTVFPFVHLFKSFRMAVSPPQLLIALAMVVVLYCFGWFLDSLFGAAAFPDELDAYAVRSTKDFAQWRKQREDDISVSLKRIMAALPVDMRKEVDGDASSRIAATVKAVNAQYEKELKQLIKSKADIPPVEFDKKQKTLSDLSAQRIAEIRQLQLAGIFETILKFKLAAFERLVRAAPSLRLGVGDLVAKRVQDRGTVLGALRDLLITLPCWMLRTHPAFSAVWLLGALALCALLGGAICRIDALDATRDEPISAIEAIAYARDKWLWFFLAPLLPLVVVLLIGGLLAVGGLLFNVPVLLDVVAAVVFGLALLGGTIAALGLIALAGGLGMLYPALAVEGTEAFDAISRAGYYVLSRPWRLIFYSLVSLVYGAITYLFVGTVIFVALTFTHMSVGVGVFVDSATAESRFDTLMPLPQFGSLAYEVDWSSLSASGKIAAGLIKVWVFLLVAVVGAYAISFYYAANTWIYLLLRRAADGAEFDDVYIEEDTAESSLPESPPSDDAVVDTNAPPAGGAPDTETT